MPVKVYLLEDDPSQRQQMEQWIQMDIMINAYDLELALATDDPHQILDQVQANEGEPAIYFFDVDLGADLNGIQVAQKVRETDDQGKIIFVTTHAESLYLTYSYMVEALGFIIKDGTDSIRSQVQQSLKLAVKRLSQDDSDQSRLYKVTIGETVRLIPVDEIYYFETSPTPHKITLYHQKGQIEFYERIKNIPDQDPSFYQCHQSYVVNLTQVDSIDKKARTALMKNGDYVYISKRQLPGFIQAYENTTP